MNCKFCNKELPADSNFCNYCGNPIEKPTLKQEKVFDFKLLLYGILISILLTLLATAISERAGLPILFGGLFLPFFWKFKNKTE